MKISILSSAEREFAEAVDYYNEQRPGLGFEFALEIKNTFERIASFPQAWPQISTRTRRCLTNKFPYGVLYQIRPDGILVTVIAHLKRDPITWQQRMT